MTEICFDAIVAELSEECCKTVKAGQKEIAKRAVYLVGILGDFYNDLGNQQMAAACSWCYLNYKRPFKIETKFYWENESLSWPSNLPEEVFNLLPADRFTTVLEALEAVGVALSQLKAKERV